LVRLEVPQETCEPGVFAHSLHDTTGRSTVGRELPAARCRQMRLAAVNQG
jgi:hypothetical protein